MEIFVETTLDGFEARMFLFEPGTQRAQQSGDFIPFRWSTFIFFFIPQLEVMRFTLETE